jgi:hypothetical protein
VVAPELNNSIFEYPVSDFQNDCLTSWGVPRRTSKFVMPRPVPGIHVFLAAKTWMAGKKPGHDEDPA